MPGFSALPERTAAVAGDARPLPLPDWASDVERELGAGSVQLTTRFWRAAGAFALRTVHIRSPKIEVVTAFAFPDADRALPVLGMELVRLGRRPIVGVLDLVDLDPGSALGADLLDEAHDRWPDLDNDDDAPDWFVDCRSGRDFFLRPEDDAPLDLLGDIHLWVSEQLFRRASDTAAAQDAPRHEAAIQAYKRHHRDHSPGLPLMNRVFGEAWTDDYMDGQLFA